MTGILVAGIGNVFKGDDGFGVAVARHLTHRPLPAAARLVDFGIRGLDLVYALLDGYSAAILIDTVQRGETPGTVYVIEPEPSSEPEEADHILLSPHEMDPQKVLRLASLLGAPCRRVVLVACEPFSFGDEQFGAMELSPPVAEAVPRAAEIIETLLRELTAETNEEEASAWDTQSKVGSSMRPAR